MMRSEKGFTVIEVMIAAVIMIVGVLGVFAALDSARVLSTVGERQTTIAHRAQQELERLQAMPYKSLAMTVAPPAASGCPTPLTPQYPTSPNCYVSGGNYSYDRNDTSKTEPLVIDTTNGTITPNGSGSGCTDGCTSKWTDGNYSGEVFDFVSWASDANCTGGTICPAGSDYKRVTVVVTLSGAAATHPSKPLLASTFEANPDALPTGAPSNSAQNPLQNINTQCGGLTCNQALNGTAVDYYLTDSGYSSSYTPPTVSNALHGTTVTLCGLGPSCAPTPDQLITTRPTTGGALPPCFSTDKGCVTTSGGGGTTPCNGGTAAADGNGNCSTGMVLTHPTSDSSSCGSPPSDNTKSHTWVTPTVPVGTSVNLTGAGGMTLYMQSTSGVAVNVLVCAGVYIQPTGLLGTLVNLLPPHVTQIGASVGANATVSAAVPTPVSFGFNLGSAATLSSTALNQVKLQVVVWLAASAGTDVGLVYDHPYASSQLTVIEQ